MEEQYDDYGNPIGQPQLNPEEAQKLKNTREQRFKNMNIPIPIPQEVIRASANIGNPEKFKKMQEIRNGLKRKDFSKYIEKENVSAAPSNLPVPKQKSKNINIPGQKKTDVKVVEHAPVAAVKNSEAERMEALLLGGYTSTPQKASRENAQFSQPTEQEAEMTSMRIHSKFQENMAKKQATLTSNPSLQQYQGTQLATTQTTSSLNPALNSYPPQVALAPGLIVISEEDLNKKIKAYAAAYCKKYVEQVMQPIQESIKKVINEMKSNISNKNTLTETGKKIKQAEVVGEGIVLIDGTYYKKATVKKTNE